MNFRISHEKHPAQRYIVEKEEDAGMQADDIFTYTDYRSFLADWFSDRKKTDAHFSYRVFSDLCGFKTKDFIFRVIQGQKNLSKESAVKVSNALGLTKRRSHFFLLLVCFNQAKSHEERDQFFTRLSLLMKEVSRSSKTDILKQDQYQVFSDRHHLVIRSLIGIYEFSGDYQWLASMVNPPITEAKAKKSVKLLEQLGLIYRGNDGVYKVTSTAISTGDEVKRHSLQKHYLKDMELAADAMDHLPRSRRNISGLTLGLSAKTYEIVVERLAAFRKEIAQLADLDREADRVYALNFHLFPLSRIPQEEEEA